MTPEDFILLASGISINPHAISHIDFSRPTVMVHVGASAIPVDGDDAVTLRTLFGREEVVPAAEEEAVHNDDGETAPRKRRHPRT